jgi:hypothetical protein
MSVLNRVRLSAKGLLMLAAAAVSIIVVTQAMPSAYAQSTTSNLSADQLAAIQAAVQTALADIDPSLSGEARAQAISQALAQVATTQINQNGAAALAPVITAAIAAGVPAAQAIAPIMPVAANLGIAGPVAVNAIAQGAVSAGASPVQITEAIIAVAAQSNVTSNAVGTGLGQAAAAIAPTNSNAATQIALVVSNEGTLSMGQAYGSSVLTNGGSQQLAGMGQQGPTANFITGAINSSNNNNNSNNNGNNGNTTTLTSNSSLSSGNNAAANAPTVNLGSGASQQIAAVGTTLSCTTPSCS